MTRLLYALCLSSICVMALGVGARNLQSGPAAAQPQPQPSITPLPPQPSITPPPPPPPLPRETSPVTVPIGPAQALPTASPQPSASPAASPQPSDRRKTLDGVWEIQLQRRDDTSYAHFNLVQQVDKLTGTFLQDGKTAPLAGTVDGNAIRIVVTKSDGATFVFSGTVDGKTDMIGMMQAGSENVPFTAAYRPKVRPLERAVTGQ